MSEAAAVQPLMLRKPVVSADGPVQSVPLALVVSDHDSVDELLQKAEGRERDEFALTALRIGVLAMKHARGQIDADAVRREGEKLMVDLKSALDQSRNEVHTNLSNSLKEYFDPHSGRFQERIERLIRQDGDLESVLRRQVGNDGSEMAKTLAAHVGENSPLMRLLNPTEAALVRAVESVTDDDDITEAIEGRVLTRLHRIRERNATLATAKRNKVMKETGALSCEVCLFDFFKRYGEWGRDYIECHHITPLAELPEHHKTKLENLALVCANCHRMIHRKKKWLTIAELRAQLLAT